MNTRKIAANIFILFFLLLQTLCVAQTGPIVSPMQVYICKGTGVVLDLSICPVSGAKFSWSVAGGGEISTSLTHRVTPTKTTSYLFKCIHPNGSILTKTVKVVVIEEIKLKNIKIEDKELTTDLRECWEESNITFKGEVVGDIPEDLQIKYIFSWGLTSLFVKEVSSSTKTVNVTLKTPVVPPTSTTHREDMTVSLKIEIGGKTICTPVQKTITLVKLWIDAFSDQLGIGTSSKSWKIVIGNPIEYKVTGVNECTCDWKISGPYKTWDLNNNLGTGLSGNNLSIDYKSIHKKTGIDYDFIGENRWLGAVTKVDGVNKPNGEVTLVCKDGRGHTRTRLLSEQRSGVGSIIFFNKDKDIRGLNPEHYKSDYPGTTDAAKEERLVGLLVSLQPQFIKNTYFPPLWYLFWKEGGVVNQLKATKSDGNPLFVWMVEPAIYGKNIRNDMIVLTDNTVQMNDGAGFTGSFMDNNGETFFRGGIGTGIQCLAEIMRHELYHREVRMLWGGIGAIRANHRDTDGLPDDEETINYREGRFPITSADSSDTYGIRNPYATFDYSDNELRCLVLERGSSIGKNVLGNPTPLGVVVEYYPFYDWSSNSDWSNGIYNKAWTYRTP